MEDKSYNNIILVSLLLVSGFIVLFPREEYFKSDSTPYFYFIVLSITTIITAYCVYRSRVVLSEIFRFDKKVIVFLSIIFLIGLSLRVYLPPNVHRILFDEDIYMQIAKEMVTSGRALYCTVEWIDGKCMRGEIDKHPNALPYSLSLFYLVFGVNEFNAYAFNILISVLSILAIFLLTYIMFDDEQTALFSALFLALTPAHIVWTGSLSSEIYHTLPSLLSVVFCIAYVRKRSYTLLFSCAGFLAFAVQSRPESLIMIPVVFLILLLNARKIGINIFMEDIFYFTTIFVMFSLLHFTHLNYFSQIHDWGAEEGKFQYDYMDRNWTDNTSYWFNGRRHLLVLTPFALIGLVSLIRRKSYLGPILFAWFFMFFLSYLFFYAGSFTSGGIGFRYTVLCYPPLIILASWGANRSVRLIGRYANRRDALFFITFLTVITFLPTVSFISSVDIQAESPRIFRDFAIKNVNEIDDNCVVFTNNPAVTVFQGQNTMSAMLALNPDFVEKTIEDNGCAYFLEGYWCYSPPNDRICDFIKKSYHLEKISTIETYESWVFNFYKLNTI